MFEKKKQQNEKLVFACWESPYLSFKLMFSWVSEHSKTPTHLANGPWKKKSNFIFPTKYGIPKSSNG